jgi:ornithine carbamoyltransferase
LGESRTSIESGKERVGLETTLKGRSLLKLTEFSASEIRALLALAGQVKAERRQGIFPQRLRHKNFAMVFLKPSARTRMSFVTATVDEGAHLEIFPAEDIRFGIKESARDVARLMGRLFDGIAFRGFEHEGLEELARFAGVPVWNCLCDLYHPTQVLADLMTVEEVFGRLDVPIAYVGDGRNNVARTLALGASIMGLDLRILAPRELWPGSGLLAEARSTAAPGCAITVTADPGEALRGAAVVYGDVWVSMGEEHEVAHRVSLLTPYRVTRELMARTGRSDTVLLHCLPSLHDLRTSFAREHPDVLDVDDQVFEGPQSRVFDQAENRMHTIKALMLLTA